MPAAVTGPCVVWAAGSAMVAPVRTRCLWLRWAWLLLCQRTPVCVLLGERVYVYGSAMLALQVLGLDLRAPPSRVRDFAQAAIPRLRFYGHCALPFLAITPSGVVRHEWAP